MFLAFSNETVTVYQWNAWDFTYQMPRFALAAAGVGGAGGQGGGAGIEVLVGSTLEICGFGRLEAIAGAMAAGAAPILLKSGTIDPLEQAERPKARLMAAAPVAKDGLSIIRHEGAISPGWRSGRTRPVRRVRVTSRSSAGTDRRSTRWPSRRPWEWSAAAPVRGAPRRIPW